MQSSVREKGALSAFLQEMVGPLKLAESDRSVTPPPASAQRDFRLRKCMDAREATGRCLEWLLCDEPWKELGFAGRPRHGVMVQFFRPQASIDFENRLKREILASITAVYAVSRFLELEEVPEVVALYAAHPFIFPLLGFESQVEARQFMQDAVNDYLNVPVPQWCALMLGRTKPGLRVNRSLLNQIEAGVPRLANRLGVAVRQLKRMS